MHNFLLNQKLLETIKIYNIIKLAIKWWPSIIIMIIDINCSRARPQEIYIYIYTFSSFSINQKLLETVKN